MQWDWYQAFSNSRWSQQALCNKLPGEHPLVRTSHWEGGFLKMVMMMMMVVVATINDYLYSRSSWWWGQLLQHLRKFSNEAAVDTLWSSELNQESLKKDFLKKKPLYFRKKKRESRRKKIFLNISHQHNHSYPRQDHKQEWRHQLNHIYSSRTSGWKTQKKILKKYHKKTENYWKILKNVISRSDTISSITFMAAAPQDEKC